MSKRLNIVVEGQTEEEFVKEVMAPYLAQYDIYVYPRIIATSKGHKGGFVNYTHLRNDVMRLLSSQGQDVIVTTFVDFFRCPEVPGKESWSTLSDHRSQVEAMEKCIQADIDDWRFLPYIQLHEFEALLFSSDKGFQAYFDNPKIMEDLSSICSQYDNPEDINSTPEGAPSKRLLRIVPDYDKVMLGNLIALEVGMETILRKCPRFRQWVEHLIMSCR